MILGPSGSGKSTLLNMLGGLDQLDSGSIEVDGVELTGLSRKQLVEYRREKIGLVFQSYNLIAELNVKENIRVVMMQLGYMSRLDSMSTAKVAYTISGFSVIRRTPGVTP